MFMSDVPAYVSIFGPTEAKVGDMVKLNCTAGASNPAASIKWLVDGRQAHNTSFRQEALAGNGWTSSSVITVPITSDKSSIVVICHGVNSYLAENVVATHTINVLGVYDY